MDEAVAGALVDAAAHRLSESGVESPRSEARLLLAHVLDVGRTELLAHPERPVDRSARDRFDALVERRAAREPFAYLVGYREFYGLRLAVDRRVLVPRPETELLVEQALAVLDRLGRDAPLVVDVGTGSGAIACAVAAQAPRARVVAVDRDADALAVADANRRALGLADRVQPVRGDLLGWLRTPADLVLANLPYVPSGRIPTLMQEVSRFEPHGALDGGSDGTEPIRRLLAEARHLTRPGGSILLEIDSEQAEPLRQAAPWATATVLGDLAGLPRLLRLDVRDPHPHSHQDAPHEDVPRQTGHDATGLDA